MNVNRSERSANYEGRTTQGEAQTVHCAMTRPDHEFRRTVPFAPLDGESGSRSGRR